MNGLLFIDPPCIVQDKIHFQDDTRTVCIQILILFTFMYLLHLKLYSFDLALGNPDLRVLNPANKFCLIDCGHLQLTYTLYSQGY